MQSRIINPEITPLKDEILKKIKELLPSPSNQKELSTITNFITFLESVYLGKPNKSDRLLMHAAKGIASLNESNFDVICGICFDCRMSNSVLKS